MLPCVRVSNVLVSSYFSPSLSLSVYSLATFNTLTVSFCVCACALECLYVCVYVCVILLVCLFAVNTVSVFVCVCVCVCV